MKAILLTVSMSLVMLAGTCLAHAKLVRSLPADNAQIAAAPGSLTLIFNETASLAVLKVRGAAKEFSIPLDKGAKPGREFTLSLPPLPSGRYIVQWSAVAADDGHVTKGSFTFTITG